MSSGSSSVCEDDAKYVRTCIRVVWLGGGGEEVAIATQNPTHCYHFSGGGGGEGRAFNLGAQQIG